MKKKKTETPMAIKDFDQGQDPAKTDPPGLKKRLGCRLNKPEDVRRLLSKNINQVLWDELPTDKIRAITGACQVILRVFEMSLFEKRLDDIEKWLGDK